MASARGCAMAMLENAIYVEKELPNVAMPDELRKLTAKVLSELIGTKHDIITEVSELDELLASAPSDAVKHAERVERIVRWLSDDMKELHGLVTALREAGDKNPDYGSALMLVMESATNILLTYNKVLDAAGR